MRSCSTGIVHGIDIPTCYVVAATQEIVRADNQRRATLGSEAEIVEQRTSFTAKRQARQVGETIGIDWASAPFDVEQFRTGLDVELEHGLHNLITNVTDSDPVVTGKIALAHLNEFPDYYTRLAHMESEAKFAR